VLHQPTGVLYLACSTPQSRSQWTPALLLLNASGRSQEDYIATYDPKNAHITRLKLSGLPSGLSVHGMDVVPSASNPKELFVYLVNHQHFIGKDPLEFGANSTIEIFKTRVGGQTLTHLHTVHSPVIITPNDLVGSPDGKSFHFTNDARSKTGLASPLRYFTIQTISPKRDCR
jgi:arylesterase / paraoxonase